MHEFIEVRFQKNGKRLRVARQIPEGGIEFAEPDPLERTIGLGFQGATAATRERMNSIRRMQGWEPGQFRLNVTVEDGSLILRGLNEHALPEGLYQLRLQIEEARVRGGQRTAHVKHDGHAVVEFPVEMDDRRAAVDLADVDTDIGDILERSAVDELPAARWLTDESRRATRRACLLNLLASVRVRPTLGAPLVSFVHHIVFAGNDRAYVKADRGLLDQLQALVRDPKKPFFAEGTPKAAIHGRLLGALPEPPAVRARFSNLLSFRAEGKPSLQIVVAVPPPDLPHTYAELDLDLANPLQDLSGIFVHLGELLDGHPTNHLDLRKQLARTRASDFLYYRVLSA